MEEEPSWQVVREVGHPWHRRKGLLSVEQIEQMMKEGFSKRQIALYYKRSRGTVYRRLKEAKLAREKAEQEEKASQKKAEEREERRRAEEATGRQHQVEIVREAVSKLPPYGKGTNDTVARRKSLRLRLTELGVSESEAARECGYPAVPVRKARQAQNP